MKSGDTDAIGREVGPTLAHIGAVVRTQLEHLDLSSAEEYLAGVRSISEPHRHHLETVRSRMRQLLFGASTAESPAELHHINAMLVTEACELFQALPSVSMVHEICTVVRGGIAARALDLARQECHASGLSSDLSLALLAVGSDGRREQSLYTDQDYLFVVESSAGFATDFDQKADDYFERLGSAFMVMLEEAGIGRCSGGIMPVNEDWRGSLEQWQERLSVMLRFARTGWEKNILNLIALVDARFICGNRELGHGFETLVRSLIGNNPDAIRHMARVVSSMKLSKGFLGRFIVEAEGPHKGEFNLKIYAWMPLVMCIRLLAVDHGIAETSTLARLGRLRSAGHLPERPAAELVEAYHCIAGHRIQQQVRKVKRISDDDCYLNPYELPHREREALKKAIGRVDELQHLIRSRYAMITSVDRLIRGGLSGAE